MAVKRYSARILCAAQLSHALYLCTLPNYLRAPSAAQVIELRQQQEAQRLDSARSSRGGMSGASPRGSHATDSQPNTGRWRDEAPAPLSAGRSTPSAAALPARQAATGDRTTSVQEPPPASATAECSGGEGQTSSQRQQQSRPPALSAATPAESLHAGLTGQPRGGASPMFEGKQRSAAQGVGHGHVPGGGQELQQQGQRQEERVQAVRSPEARRELASMREQYALLQGRYEEQAARQRELQELLLRLSGRQLMCACGWLAYFLCWSGNI